MMLSIRTRLSFAFTLTFAALLILFTGVVYLMLQSGLTYKLREDSLHDMRILIGYLSGKNWLEEVKEMPEESNEFRLLIKILTPEGKVFKLGGNVRESDWPTDVKIIEQSLKNPIWTDMEINGEPYLVLTQPFNPPGLPTHFLQIANSKADLDEILRKFVYYVNIGSLLVLIAAAIAGRIFSRKALQPVEHIRIRAQTIKSDNLHERLVYEGPPDELHRLTDTLNDLLGRIQQSIRQMKGFIADASHELRIPLAGIRGTLEVGLRQKRSPEESREIMKTAFHESERMSELVSNLLSLARADAGELKLEKTNVNIEEFLKHVFESAGALNAEKTVTLRLGDIPKGTAHFDEARIHQLLINLIENAIRYNKPGGEVVLSAALKENYLRISVKDTGIGIAAEDQAKIFDRFYRVDKARSREAGGTGLGLAIARAIAEAHDGNLHLNSSIDSGSEFTLKIPLS